MRLSIFATSLLAVILLISFCGTKTEAPYQAGDKEYDFFVSLSDSLNIPEIQPQTPSDLIKTDRFTISTWDVMPFVYLQVNQYRGDIHDLTAQQIKGQFMVHARNECTKNLLLEAAKGKQYKVHPDSLTHELESIYQRYGSEEGFYQQMAKNGFEKEQIENDIKDNLRIQNYLRHYLITQVPVSDEEIQAAYEQDKTATVRHILFMTRNAQGAAKEAIRKKAEAVLKRAKNGEDFAELAKEYTEDPGSKDNGGLYENFPRGQMVPPFNDASFSVPVGEISDLVETQYGYHIIKVISRAKETRPLEEVRDELTFNLARQSNPRFMQSVVDSLKTEYNYEELLTI